MQTCTKTYCPTSQKKKAIHHIGHCWKTRSPFVEYIRWLRNWAWLLDLMYFALLTPPSLSEASWLGYVTVGRIDYRLHCGINPGPSQRLRAKEQVVVTRCGWKLGHCSSLGPPLHETRFCLWQIESNIWYRYPLSWNGQDSLQENRIHVLDYLFARILSHFLKLPNRDHCVFFFVRNHPNQFPMELSRLLSKEEFLLQSLWYFRSDDRPIELCAFWHCDIPCDTKRFLIYSPSPIRRGITQGQIPILPVGDLSDTCFLLEYILSWRQIAIQDCTHPQLVTSARCRPAGPWRSCLELVGVV